MFGSSVKKGFQNLVSANKISYKRMNQSESRCNLKTNLSGLTMIYLYHVNLDLQNIPNAIEWKARKIFNAKGTVIYDHFTL